MWINFSSKKDKVRWEAKCDL